MNIMYIGSSTVLSLFPFNQLLSSHHPIVAVGVHRPVVFQNKVIALENESLALSANQHEIPLIDLSQPVGSIIDQCIGFSIDVILMSCYSKRLPGELLQLASKGCFNMHPSLLPKYRGAEPIFWQMKNDDAVGVSWHKVIAAFDAGDIVGQQKIRLDEGASYAEISTALAEAGTRLMSVLLSELSAGSLTSRPQVAEMATYYPYPEAADFVVDTAWSARHAYNFMRATHAFGQPFLCRIGSHQYKLDKAIDYVNNASLDELEVKAKTLYIPCNEGVLMATYTGKLY